MADTDDRRRHRQPDQDQHPGRLDRSGHDGRRHRPRARRGRGAEGRQRPPRHRDEPGPAGLHAVPAGDAARPDRRRLDRPRPVRAVLRALQPHPLHPAVPGRLRAGARRPRGAAHLGLADPRATRSTGHTRGVEITTGPLGQGLASAVGMAMAARRERGLFDPDAAPGREPVRPPHLRDRLRRRHRGGRHLRGVLARRHPAAGQPDADLRRQQDLHRGRHRHRAVRGRRRRATRPTAGTCRSSRAARTSPASWRRWRRPRPSHRPAVVHPAAHDHRLPGAEQDEHRQGARRRAGRRRGRRDQGDPRLRPGARPSRSTTRCSRTPARSSSAGAQAHAEWQKPFDAWAAARARAQGAARPADRRASCPTGWDEGAAQLGRRPQGRRHPQGVRRGAQRAGRRAARAVGRLGRPRREQQHHDGGRRLVRARRRSPPRCGTAQPYGRTLHFGIREHAMGSILNGIALHGPTRPYGGTFLDLQRLHAPARSGWPR